jgi:hypothetical protein
VRDQDIAVSLAGADIDGDPLLYTLVAEPDHGAMSGTPPHLVYTPHPGYTGPDSFTFKVNDTQLDSNEAVVSITVNSPTPLSVFLDDFRYVLLETGKYLQNLFSSTAFLDFIKMFSARLDLAACGA